MGMITYFYLQFGLPVQVGQGWFKQKKNGPEAFDAKTINFIVSYASVLGMNIIQYGHLFLQQSQQDPA